MGVVNPNPFLLVVTGRVRLYRHSERVTMCGCVTTPVSLADEKPPGWENLSFREGRSRDPQSGVLVCDFDAPGGFPLGAASWAC